MIRFIFIIPLVLSLLWITYLKMHGWTLKQGQKGFVYIAIISTVIALFYTLMMWLTGRGDL
ncbi:hypothetical protein DFP83_107136 [Idiomarina fontislapidosi]|uniref:Uncharacterized protein n=1 Tax=Idiomarina fontislapidosi TaxID=263723 RepID=A0A432XX50_9GAMM|nr:hypothetical protein [Idiomarina fontislapidosi]PYE32115.1 hypothetical protein DFP83_107136 [Idiomarina fontislapidosi]RUO53318.1 hypothetical protein CWE25_08875 [Idiomarina fontislapidosi]|tara:strand:+ start:3587 stop:3769 length:183 start_codon:yes stop_codon:yes gene_type:complete